MIARYGVAEVRTVVQMVLFDMCLDLNIIFVSSNIKMEEKNENKPRDFMLTTHSDNPQS